MSYISVTYHLVFSAKHRRQTIDMRYERELYKVIYAHCVNHGAYVRRIGGMPDHVHILIDIPAKTALADFVRLLKSETSKFMRVNSHFPNWLGWADGYGAFSVDADNREIRCKYIQNQKEHHKAISFIEEYRELLRDIQKIVN